MPTSLSNGKNPPARPSIVTISTVILNFGDSCGTTLFATDHRRGDAVV